MSPSVGKCDATLFEGVSPHFSYCHRHMICVFSHIVSHKQWVDGVCEKCILLNKECLFAVLVQSMHCGKGVTESCIKKYPYQQCHGREEYME